MDRKHSWLLGLAIIVVFAAPVQGQDIDPGLVLLTTSTLETTAWMGTIPAGKFGPGSDELQGVKLVLRGHPLQTLSGNPSVFWPADTLVNVKQGVDFPPGLPVTRTVETQVMALSLAGAVPLVVTYGGTNPELWDLRVCLHVPLQRPGLLALTNDCGTAGTFVHTMVVLPKLIFTRQRDGIEVILDAGTGSAELDLIGRGYWTRREYATGSYASAPQGAKLDADCNGEYDDEEVPPPTLLPLPGTSNLLLGVARVNCNAADPNHGYEAIRPTTLERKDTFVLEPATQDDRVILWNQSALPQDVNPRAAKGLGALAVLGLATAMIRPGARK